MKVWFDGTQTIDCTIDDVKESLGDLGRHHVGVVGRLPGMHRVELVEQGPDAVTIRTNEGLMNRRNITQQVETERVVVEFDETYEAGSRVTANSHFLHEFTASDGGVTHRLVMSDVEANGLLGFFYRRFGSAKMGKAFLAASAGHLANRPA